MRWFRRSRDHDDAHWHKAMASLLPGSFVVSTVKLGCTMFFVHIAIFALGQTVLAPFNLAHLAGAEHGGGDAETFHIPSFLYLRLLIAATICASFAAGLAYFDLKSPRIAVNAAGGLTAGIACAELVVHFNSPILLFLCIELVLVQTAMTRQWTRSMRAQHA